MHEPGAKGEPDKHTFRCLPIAIAVQTRSICSKVSDVTRGLRICVSALPVVTPSVAISSTVMGLEEVNV